MAKEVAPGVYQVPTQFKAANAFLIVEDELILIDTGLKGSQSRIERLLKELDRSPREITQIILTHCHVDHAGSLAALRELSGAKVVVHRADADYLSKEAPYPKPKVKPLSWMYAAFMLPLFNCPAITADTLLDDGSELKALGGLKVIHTPGHTPGHIALYSPERKILFAGDALRLSRGKLKLPYRMFTDNWDQARGSLDRLRGLQVDTICLSHGGAVTIDALAKLEAFLDGVTP